MSLSPRGPSEEGVASLGEDLSLQQPMWVMNELLTIIP